MKKKILGLSVILMLIAMLIALTGCGQNEEKSKINKEYEKYIETVRNAQASAYMENYTLGELYDNALIDSTWDVYNKELPSGKKKILISVKGNDKFSDNVLTEVVYEVNTETLEYKYHQMYVNNEKSYNITTLLKKSADDLKENN